MQNTHFVELAKRTESVIEKVNVDVDAFMLTLQIFTMTAQILDGFKKSIFYNKDDKLNKTFDANVEQILDMAENLNNIVLSKDTKSVLQCDSRVLHGILGNATESAELVEALLSNLNGNDLDKYNIQEEMGDGSWYDAILHDALGLNPEETLTKVINKLKVRYPDKYSDTLAENRNLEEERKILEG